MNGIINFVFFRMGNQEHFTTEDNKIFYQLTVQFSWKKLLRPTHSTNEIIKLNAKFVFSRTLYQIKNEKIIQQQLIN